MSIYEVFSSVGWEHLVRFVQDQSRKWGVHSLMRIVSFWQLMGTCNCRIHLQIFHESCGSHRNGGGAHPETLKQSSVHVKSLQRRTRGTEKQGPMGSHTLSLWSNSNVSQKRRCCLVCGSFCLGSISKSNKTLDKSCGAPTAVDYVIAFLQVLSMLIALRDGIFPLELHFC